MIYDLGDKTCPSAAVTDLIITAGVNDQGTPCDYLPTDDAVSVGLSFDFKAGTTNATGFVIVYTAFGDQAPWFPIARFDFTNANVSKALNVASGTTRAAVLDTSPLNAEGAVDGVLGDRLQARLTTTDVYTGGIVAVRAQVRG